jgi:hypothetical protein
LESDAGSKSSGQATLASKDIAKATASALRRMSIASGNRKKSVNQRKMVEELLVSEKVYIHRFSCSIQHNVLKLIS